MDRANRAGELERDAELLIADVQQHGVADSGRACSDLESAVAALLDVLSEAALTDPRDEMPVDGGISP
jgi:hypothetical protein